MPQHRILGDGDVAPECASDCRRAWCLFTGDGAERGPILEMVTEKYLLRSDAVAGAAADVESVAGNLEG